ncbi:MAG: ECF transporter S component [Lachnospiraceae bacterium]|nr:ECF transporter S component [Lachnospiraceae bacterium]
MVKNTKMLTTIALLTAMYVALSYVAIDLRFMKLSFAGLPICIGGLLLGGVPGFMIGFLGSFLEQLIRYGLGATTLLWVLPVAVRGLIVGIYSQKKKFILNIKEMGFILILSAIILTILNTFSLYIDSRLMGYYSFHLIFGMVGIRILTGIVTSIIYLIIVPIIIKEMKKIVDY